MSKTSLHRRLSRALYDVLDYGKPVRIRMAKRDWYIIVEELKPYLAFRRAGGVPEYEGVPVELEKMPFSGCVIEHDNSYLRIGTAAVPDTVVLMRDSRRPALIAWRESQA